MLPTTRSARLRRWWSEQVTLSRAILLAGSLALAGVLLGSLVLLITGGLKPYERIYETAISARQSTLLFVCVLIGAGTAVAGFISYRWMPTKAAREAAISGAALGMQAIIFGALYQVLREGERFELFVRQNFNFQVLEGTGRFFWAGARNTVFLAFSGEMLGIAIGLVMSMLILSKRVVVRAPARVYVNFFRGTPLLWQLAFIYAGIVLGARLPLGVYQTAILILGLNAGAYTAEIFRAGIQSLERGQMEAARSLGMSYMQAMRYSILPQAIRRVIPPLTNEFIILIKDTSLVVFLGLVATERELFGMGRDFYAETFNSTPYLATAAGYLAVTLPMIRVVTMLEKKLRSGLAGIVG